MTFDAVPAGVLDLLQRQGQVSYRALKRRVDLDDDYLEALKAELTAAQQLARDEAGEVLVWTGARCSPWRQCLADGKFKSPFAPAPAAPRPAATPCPRCWRRPQRAAAGRPGSKT